MPKDDHGRPLRVLHLEDCEADGELIARRLKKGARTFEIVRASNQADYRRALEAGEIDVILSDYAMPGFDGMAALKLAKELRPDVPFIFVSGTIGEERAIASLQAGATDYILKDRIERLPTAIRRAAQEAEQSAERARALAALRDSEERFRQVTENIDEVFWLADVEPRQMAYVSRAYARIWGRPREQLYAAPNSWLDSVHPEDRPRVETAVAQQATGDYDIEYRIIRPDGSVRWINDRAFPIRNPGGRIFRVAGIAQDITTRRNLEQEVCQANKMEALGQFAGGIAHDFNNVLAVIQMQTSLLLSSALAPKQRSGLENVLAATARAANLTRQLLTFSRRELNQARDIDLVEVVSGTLKLLRRIVGENIAFETQFPPGLPAVHADPGMVEQVLMNLVINARDAMSDGGRLLVALDKLEAGAERVAPHTGVKPGRFLCLSVTDTGCGIPDANLARIFEPFFTTKEPGCGTGLGLATVCRIAAQHQGWVDVESEVGKGTTFRAYFPALDRPAVKATSAPERLLPGSGERILLVEDDEAVRAIARAVLERFGYHVTDAATGAEALKRWEEGGGNFDLLLADLILPGGMTGNELARRLIAAKPGLVVIYASGYNNEIVARHISLDSDPILRKPYSAEDLVSMVRSRIDRARKAAGSNN